MELPADRNGQFMSPTEIDGRRVNMLVDTGATFGRPSLPGAPPAVMTSLFRVIALSAGTKHSAGRNESIDAAVLVDTHAAIGAMDGTPAARSGVPC